MKVTVRCRVKVGIGVSGMGDFDRSPKLLNVNQPCRPRDHVFPAELCFRPACYTPTHFEGGF